MEFILAKCERDLQKLTLAIRCQKYSVYLVKAIGTAVELWTKRYAASNSRVLDLAL